MEAGVLRSQSLTCKRSTASDKQSYTLSALAARAKGSRWPTPLRDPRKLRAGKVACQRAASSPSETLVPTLQKPDLDRLETLIYLADSLLSRSGCQKPTVGFWPEADLPDTAARRLLCARSGHFIADPKLPFFEAPAGRASRPSRRYASHTHPQQYRLSSQTLNEWTVDWSLLGRGQVLKAGAICASPAKISHPPPCAVGLGGCSDDLEMAIPRLSRKRACDDPTFHCYRSGALNSNATNWPDRVVALRYAVCFRF